ncbi:MAG: ribokinase [Acidobacteriota bacterium]|nr:ribokinase [Acidobacteriota bacterium]
MSNNVLVMGSFVADLAFRASRLPGWGETLMGDSFALGPGGKGSNQAVAAARAGANVRFMSKLGDDAFGKIARDLWRADGIDAALVGTCGTATGAAAILIDAAHGENAIIVVPGACFTLTPAEVDAAANEIRAADVFLTQLELPLDTVARGLEIARDGGVPTILNPAPAPTSRLPSALIALADYFIPNETEAALLTGLTVETVEQAERAADSLLEQGAGNVILTLGARGSLLRTGHRQSTLVPAFNAGPVLETTGAGDAFCGAFAAALGEGRNAVEAARFASAAAGISVTRPGTAPSMPRRAEIEALLNA